MENNLENENKQSCLSPLSGSLHPDNEKLLQQCFLEFRDKMIKNEQKHGWTNEWLTNDWENECRIELYKHIEKGDPKDVCIYGMFMVYRGWKTNDGSK